MILEEETYRKFGYYPSDWAPRSHKKILAACDECGKVRVISKGAYRSLCKSCRQKGEKSHFWPSGKVKVNCENCGKVIEKCRSQIEKYRYHFCNNKCQGQWQSRETRGEKCSGWKGGKVKVQCDNCGKVIEHISYRIKRNKHHFCDTECKKLWQRKYPKKISKTAKPTKPERIFEAICKKYNLPFRYVGDGKLWIGKKGGKKLNPDFIECNGKKIVIEIMGEYWHAPLLKHKKLREDALLNYRLRFYKRFKLKSIFIWDIDLLRKDAEQFVLNLLRKEGVIK